MTGPGRRKSAKDREAWRKRWRAFLLPHWKRLSTDVLDAREAKVVALRLGIASDVGLAHGAIARRLHITGASIARIETEALAKIRGALQLEDA